jgi:ABC-type spermidine/putrescine transport system permease subunit II
MRRCRTTKLFEIAASVLALALVLPVLGGVIYGFETGWDALGFSALGVMALLMSAYYLIFSDAQISTEIHIKRVGFLASPEESRVRSW